MQNGLLRWMDHCGHMTAYATRSLRPPSGASYATQRNDTLYQVFSTLGGMRDCALLILQYVPCSAAPRPPFAGA
jgi:hypothetical protein